MSAPVVGSLAPDFDLACTRVAITDPPRASLARYRGRWLVLAFYPRDFSLVCPTELTALSVRIDEFAREGCDLLGISSDTLESHQRWIATPKAQGGLGGLRFPLASDPDGAAATAYGVYLAQQRVALRGLFIIDPNGVLQYQAVHNLSVGRRSEEVLRVLAALQTGGLCAENWTPEKEPLEPVGSIGPGSMVGPYRVERELGSGTFAAVFQAIDTVLERTVALKVIRRDCPLASSKVLAEARLAASLNHPNVCTVYAVDDSEGVPVIAMEYLSGEPLSKLLEQGPLAVEEAARIGRQVAAALAAAHAAGIVHGDLKPANVMVNEEGLAKVLDFGLSRRIEAALAPDATTSFDEGSPGSVTGTPRYMSPEQAQGQPATAASDVFSMGVMLYETLTGKRLFDGRNILEVLSQVSQIDPDAAAAAVPPFFSDLLAQALVKDPAQRHISMRDIGHRLTEAEGAMSGVMA